MLKKINLSSLLAALVLFFFPWVDVRCSQVGIATQTGLQVVYGGSSVSEELYELAAAQGADMKEQFPDDDEIEPGFSPLVGIALLIVVLAVIVSTLALFRRDVSVDRLAIFPSIALALLLIQLAIGFPIEHEMESWMRKEGASLTKPAQEDALGLFFDAARYTRMKPAFFLELLALGVPILILANGWIDKCRKRDEGAPISRSA